MKCTVDPNYQRNWRNLTGRQLLWLSRRKTRILRNLNHFSTCKRNTWTRRWWSKLSFRHRSRSEEDKVSRKGAHHQQSAILILCSTQSALEASKAPPRTWLIKHRALSISTLRSLHRHRRIHLRKGISVWTFRSRCSRQRNCSRVEVTRVLADNRRSWERLRHKLSRCLLLLSIVLCCHREKNQKMSSLISNFGRTITIISRKLKYLDSVLICWFQITLSKTKQLRQKRQ